MAELKLNEQVNGPRVHKQLQGLVRRPSKRAEKDLNYLGINLTKQDLRDESYKAAKEGIADGIKS